MLNIFFPFSRKTKLPKSTARYIDYDSIKIVKKLQKSGYKSYLVGGCVRDLLLGVKPLDFDISTNARPSTVKALIGRSFVIGKRFKIVVAYRKEFDTKKKYNAILKKNNILIFNEKRKPLKEFQITTFRRPPEIKNGVLNENVYGNPKQDSMRRDFTINALALDPTNLEIYDFNNGVHDLKKKKIVIIGNPKKRFIEDPIRILRAIRFKHRYDFTIEAKTMKGITQTLSYLKKTKMERIREELVKMVKENIGSKCFDQFWKEDLWTNINSNLNISSYDKNKKPLINAHIKILKTAEKFPWPNKDDKSVYLFFVFFPFIFSSLKQGNLAKIKSLLKELKVYNAEIDDILWVGQRLFKQGKDQNFFKGLKNSKKIRLYNKLAYICFILSESNFKSFKKSWPTNLKNWALLSNTSKNKTKPEKSNRKT